MKANNLRASRPLFAVLVIALTISAPHGRGASSGPSGDPGSWVTVGTDGQLQYQTDNFGDRIVDFSHAGYGGGGMRLPSVSVKKEVSPSGADDTAAIQAAIEAVAALPLAKGLRGAVLLRAGTFHCSAPLVFSQDGIVLRGSGPDAGGTVLEMTGAPHTGVVFKGERLNYPKENPASTIAITDSRVPSGAVSISVQDTTPLAVGDAVRIRWLRSAKWIHFMGMDTLVRDGKPQTWMKSDSPVTFDRTIRAIDGHRVTLDVPLTDAIDASFLAPGAAVVFKTTAPKRLTQCGLESLRIKSPLPSGNLTAPNNTAATLDACEDCWIKAVAMEDTLNNVKVGGDARRLTIEEVHATHSATVAKGAGYPADFLFVGSQVLLNRCSSTGDGSFFVATLNSSATLNVALNCEFRGKGGIQPHMHWSTGLLLDSCHVPEGKIDFINRNTSGSGHGWAIGWGVAWNCVAKEYDIQQPPGAINWCIGCTGPLDKNSAQPGPWLSSPGTPVTPRSLYLAQLRDRLGDIALKNIGY
jgi:hypothetical protein